MSYIRNNHSGGNTQAITKITLHDKPEIASLVRKAAGGSFEAFGKIYHIYVEAIYRYVFYQVKDKMAAEDITEEVFLKALDAIKSCKGKEATFSSWLYRIAHNQVIDNFRRSKKQSMTIGVEKFDNMADPKQEVGKGLERQELLQVIARLPQNQGQVIILKFIEGLDNREVGQIMGKSEGAIRILQMRALTSLREMLGKR
ncbi:sigma-70 family RNA polymerase sigma factor [Chloroflexota bacterium]